MFAFLVLVKLRTNYLYKIFYSSAIFLLLNFNGCNANNQDHRGIKTEILLKKILKHPDLEQYYHSKIKNRVPIIIKVNGDFDTNIKIIMFNVPIQLIENTKIVSKGRPFFKINSFYIKNDEVTFNITYDVEGILIKGKLIQKNNKWVFLEYEIIEK